MSLDLGTLVGHTKLDDSQLQSGIRGAKAQIKALRKDLDSVAVTKARIDADSAGADAKVKQLKAELAGLDKEVKLGVVTEQTDARIRQVKAELASISDAKVKIDVASTEASARIKELKAQLAELGANDHTARVRVDVDRAGVQGISTMTAALLALGPALAPLAVVSVGGLAAVGPALLAGGAAAGVAALAFHGVGDALTALTAHHQAAGQEALASASQQRSAAASVAGAEAALAGARRSAAQGAASAGQAIADAQRGVTRAEQQGALASQQAAAAVADARRGVVRATEQAAEGVQSALRQQTSAEEQLASAQRDAKQAQQDLTDAREAARRKLEQYTLDVAEAALNEQSAQLDLADSKRQLDAVNADPTSTIEARQRAELAYEQQLLQVKELSVHNKELRDDAADAAKKGVQGADEVVAARQREKDATQQVRDAQRGLTDAVAAVARAHRDGAREIADAQRQVSKALAAQAQTEISNSQQVADAQRSLARARQAAGIQAVNSAAAVADAQRNLNTALANQHALNGQVSASQQKLNDTMAALSPAGRDFVRFLSRLGPVLRPLQAAAQTGLFSGITRGIKAALPALPNLRGAIAGVSKAMGGMAADLGRMIGGPGGRAFIDFIGKTAPPLLRQFGKTAGYVSVGLMSMAETFMPVTTMIAGGITHMARSFASFSTGGGFQPLVAFMLKNGPVIAGILGRITSAAGRLVVAAVPIGMVVLHGLGKVADVINALPVHVLTALVGVLGTMVAAIYGVNLAVKAYERTMIAYEAVSKLWAEDSILMTAGTKAWAGAQWLLNAAMDANPIGLVVIAIAALVAGFIIAYKKSETFRAIVNGALRGIRDAAQAVVGWFEHTLVPFFTEKIPAAFHATVAWVRHNWPVILAILTGPIGLATLYVSRHWDQITGAFKAARDWVTGAFNRSWSALAAILAAPVRTARDIFGNLLGKGGPIRSAFSAAVAAIGAIWGKLRNAALAPVRFIVNTVYNNGIRRVVNAIPGIPGTLGLVKGFRTGGPTGNARDDQAVGVVHGNEHVVTAAEVRHTPGGHGTWERLRAAALAGSLPGYQTGGKVGDRGGDTKSADTPAPPRRQPNAVSGWGGISNWVHHHLGIPYRWGVTDCSWFTQSALAAGGHHVPRTAATQQAATAGIGRGAVRAGDLGFVGRPAHHVGIYMGGGRWAAEHHTGTVSSINGGDGWNNYGRVGGKGTYVAGLGSPFAGVSTSGVSAYSGPSLASVLKYLHPGTWIGKLKGMGGWGPMLGRTVGNMASSVKHLATERIHAAIKAAGNASLGAPGGGAARGPVQTQVRMAAKRFGWGTGDEWNAIFDTIQAESGWNPHAANPHSSARGLFQKMTSIHGPVEKTPYGQAMWGLNYIKNRYGDPIREWNFHKSHGWYDQGGIASGAGYMEKRIIKPERVLSPRQTDLHDRQTVALEKLAAGGGQPQQGGSLAPLIGSAVIRETVDLERYERQRAFRDRMAYVGG